MNARTALEHACAYLYEPEHGPRRLRQLLSFDGETAFAVLALAFGATEGVGSVDGEADASGAARQRRDPKNLIQFILAEGWCGWPAPAAR